jgi:hypothetical protein
MNIYMSDDLATLHIGDFDLPLTHIPQWKRQTLLEAIWKESSAAENDADTRNAETADGAFEDGSNDMRQRVSDVLSRMSRDAPDDEAYQTIEAVKSEMEGI